MALGLESKALGIQRSLRLGGTPSWRDSAPREGGELMARIGVFVCHCGENIGRTVDCAKVAGALKDHPGVVESVDYKYMCSDPGQALIRQSIAENNLTGVVVAACSPHMHERTFRRAAFGAGLNPLPVRNG